MKRAVKLVISLGFLLFLRATRATYWILGRLPPARCVVLYYHGIPHQERAGFARQMLEVRRRTTPISAGSTRDLKPGRNYAVVTFDDAFRSVASNAVPALVANEIPFTVFAPSRQLGGPPGWDMDPTSSDRREVVMAVDELAELPGHLAEIGSHTRTHPHLTALPNEAALDELRGSRLDLEPLLGRGVDLLAFPYGDFDDRIIGLSRDAGYRRVFTIDPGVTSLRDDEYAVPRVPVSAADPILEFRLKLAGAYSWMPWATAMKRALAERPKR